MQTPWGQSQIDEQIATGIIRVHTEGHGGIYLTPASNASVHKAWRKADGFYEEDAEWSIVALTYPHHFTAVQLVRARQLAKTYHGDQYEVVFKGKLGGGPAVEPAVLDNDERTKTVTIEATAAPEVGHRTPNSLRAGDRVIVTSEMRPASKDETDVQVATFEQATKTGEIGRFNVYTDLGTVENVHGSQRFRLVPPNDDTDALHRPEPFEFQRWARVSLDEDMGTYDALLTAGLIWNGFECPAFPRDQVELMRERFAKLAVDVPSSVDTLRWAADDPTVLEVVSSQYNTAGEELRDGDEPAVERVEPTGWGLYQVGGWKWSWGVVEHELILTPSNNAPQISRGWCSCGGWHSTGAYSPDGVREDYEREHFNVLFPLPASA